MVMKLYQHVLALAFAINEINKNSKILPNITLGFHIYDSYNDLKMTYRTTIDLLFNSVRFFPNYKCGTQANVIAVTGGLDADISYRMADFLGPYKIPQITYGSFAFERQDSSTPSMYRVVPSEVHLYLGIFQLLLHFQWTWVGILVSDDESGEHFLKTVEPLLAKNGICLASTGRIPHQGQYENIDDINTSVDSIHQCFTDERINVYILHGRSVAMMSLNNLILLGDPTYKVNAMFRKVWILTAQVDFTVSGVQRAWNFNIVHRAISFSVHSREVLGFQKFLQLIKPNWTKKDDFLRDFWEQAFDCTFPDPQESMEIGDFCTGEEKLKNLPGPVFEMHMTGHSYAVYNAVYAVAHALNALHNFNSYQRSMRGAKIADPQDLQPWQLHSFLQRMSFNNSAGETISFHGGREFEAEFDIMSLVTFPNQSFFRTKVGSLDPNAPVGKQFTIYKHPFVRQTTSDEGLPRSLCSDHCTPGYHKEKKEGQIFCCYNCAPCPEEEISAQRDMDDCIKCPEDQYASKDHSECILKVISFLSFEEWLGITLASVIVFFCLITLLVLGTFIKHKDMPIVKANNRDISYALLIFLLLCFLCSLLFLGKPNEVTCFLRQSVFGLIFSGAVSCVLSKTITVVVAFMATKPGSIMRRWVGKRLTGSVVLSCSLLQAAICTVWLGTSPPFPDFDTQSLGKEIAAVCNEGSVVMFYISLGYMGLLSAISLTVAFLARNLPDTFNESKHITFSMLIFCSVWVSFVPTYLSTKGKYMVAVEIFSILASSAGLLGCIFFPKLYIILLRPELNNRDLLTRRRN